MKYKPIPRDLINLTTWTICFKRYVGILLNNKCASSKKKTIFGLSKSPTSGILVNKSVNSHNRNDAYKSGLLNNSTACKILIYPLPSISCFMKSWTSSSGSPKNKLAPWSSSVNKLLWITPTDCVVTLPYFVT